MFRLPGDPVSPYNVVSVPDRPAWGTGGGSIAERKDRIMQYRSDRNGRPVSLLGYGCMRFTTKGGQIDIPKAREEIRTAYEAGVTYFDTAYTYPGSEEALGEILSSLGIRDRVSVATKLPHYLVRTPESIEKYFTEELRRLRTDHVDYYLMHMLTDVQTWERLCSLGIEEWIAEKKRSGKIRNIGFSYHGNADMFIRLLDAYDWDFCQIQYNYMDEHSQAGRTGLLYAAEKGLPVIIMEPLRGGRLADRLPADAMEKIASYPIRRSPAEWAFRWLYDQKEVTCVLSGMNSVGMVEENARVASEASAGCMTEEEHALITELRDSINKKIRVGCTGCRYCMPCPHNVDIPGTFSAYNRIGTDGFKVAFKEYFMCVMLRKQYAGPFNCIGCGICEKRCPQGIGIRKELKNARRSLEPLPVRLMGKILPHFMRY